MTRQAFVAGIVGLLAVGILAGCPAPETETPAMDALGAGDSTWGGGDSVDGGQPGDDGEPVPLVVAKFEDLKHHGEWLGFHKGGEGKQVNDLSGLEKYDNHNQGIVRRPGPGAPYFVVTRSVEPPSSSTVLVVQMGSRDTTGERLRSNRLRPGSHTRFVEPRVEDKVLYHFVVPPPDVPGDYSRVYKHPGSMQIVDDIVAIPLEKPRDPNDPKAKIIFMDLSPLDEIPGPQEPTFLPYSLDLYTHDAGILGMTKLPESDGRVLMAFTWGHNEKLEFWLSNVTDLRKLGQDLSPERPGETGKFELYYTWDHSEANGYWPIKTEFPDYKGCFQGLSFVTEGLGGLHLIGFRHTDSRSPFPISSGHNEARAYEVGLVFEGGRLKAGEAVTLTEAAHKEFSTKTIGWGDRTEIEANFAAGTSVYISPRGEMIVYACEHWTDGPGDTYKMAEFRHRDVFRRHSPAYGPTVDVGGDEGRYEVDEGSSIVLDSSATTPPLAKAWLELYSHSDYEGKSVMFDVVDRPLRTWHNFSKIEDTDLTRGINDWASSLRWFAPPGGTFTVCSDFSSTGEKKLPLNGTGKPESIEHLSALGMNDIFSSLDFGGAAEGTVQSVLWHIQTTPPLGILYDEDTYTPLYHAVEGTYVGGSPSEELVQCTAWSNLVTPGGSNASSSATAHVVVYNLPPDVEIDRIDDQTGGTVNGGVPVLLEGVEYVLIGSFTDSGVEDTHTAAVEWGDGVTNTSDQAMFELADSLGGVSGTVRVPHAYLAPGVYTITLTVEDDDGDAAQATRDVEVVDAIGALLLCVERLYGILEDPELDPEAADAIEKAIAKLEGNNGGAANNGAIDLLDKGLRNAALGKVLQSAEYLVDAGDIDPAQFASLEPIQRLMTVAAKSVALKAIAEAELLANSPQDHPKITEAYTLVAEGDAAQLAGDYPGAASSYQEAARCVQGIH